MIKYDTIKLLIPKQYYKIRKEEFDLLWDKGTIEEKKITSRELINSVKYNTQGVSICKLNKDKDLIFEFSSKILLNDYINLLNIGNIKTAYCFLKQVGVIIDYNTFLEKSIVCRSDLCLNIKYDTPLKDLILALQKDCIKRDVYNFNPINNGTLNILKNKDKRYKIELTLYDKYNSLKNNKFDKKFLKWLSKNHYDEKKVLEDHRGIIRLELKMKSFQQIKKRLNIEDNNLKSVLCSDEKNILSSILKDAINLDFNDIIEKKHQEKREKHNLSDLTKGIGFLYIGIAFDFDVKQACRWLRKSVKIDEYQRKTIKSNFQELKRVGESLENNEIIKEITLGLIEKIYDIAKDQDLNSIRSFIQQIEECEINQ